MDLQPQQVLRLRIPLEDYIAMGPGKAALLEAILATGSISAAGRKLGMSYRKAWQLVDQMNHCFTGPVVTAVTGGAGGGGARVTDLGLEALRQFRALEARAWEAIQPGLGAFSRLMQQP